MIWVVGLHHSGSSCVAMCLQHLGLYLGDSRGRGYNANRGGSGEDYRLARICESYYRFPRTTPSRTENDVLPDLADLCHDLQREADQLGRPLVALKYPTLLAMRRIASAIDSRLRCIRIVRPIDKSIASLEKRCHKAKEDARNCQNWLNSFSSDWESTDSYAEVHYDALVDDPRSELQSIVDWLGILPASEQLTSAVSSVHPHFRHF